MSAPAQLLGERHARTALPDPSRRPIGYGRLAVLAYCSLSYIFLLSPLVVVLGASLSGGDHLYTAVSFPPKNITLKWYFEIPRGQIRALGVSLGLAALAALGAAMIGIPAALGLVRSNLPGRYLLAALFRAPMQIPAVVTGLAFLQLYYVILQVTGIGLNNTFIGLLIGHLFIGTPFVVGAVTAVLQRFDSRLEEAGLIMGASPLRVLWKITLPSILPGIYTGCLYAFMVSFADVPVAIFLAGSGFATYPVELFFALENDFSPTILASSTLVIFISLGMLLAVQRIVGLDAMLRSSGGGR